MYILLIDEVFVLCRFYEDSTCSGDAIEYEGFTVDKCFNAGPYFAEYTCDGGEIYYLHVM